MKIFLDDVLDFERRVMKMHHSGKTVFKMVCPGDVFSKLENAVSDSNQT